MLMTFKSRASSDVTYFKAVATDILILLGKNPEASQGVFTVEQLGPAIVTLKRVIEQPMIKSCFPTNLVQHEKNSYR